MPPSPTRGSTADISGRSRWRRQRGAENLTALDYAWDASGNLTTLADGPKVFSNTYDHQSRLTSGLGDTFTYRADDFITNFDGTVLKSIAAGHGIDARHADGIDWNVYDYDAAGTVTRRQYP